MTRQRWICILLTAFSLLTAPAQDVFEGARWIGAITREKARIPEGRHYNGSALKQTRPLWEAADTLSRRSILVRHNLKVGKGVRSARIHIAGLGFYELTINGRKVGQSAFAPLWSDYDKTVFYNTLDVDTCLQRGSNEICVLLGNGFYNEQGGRYHKLKVSFGPPTLLFTLDVVYQNGRRQRLVSDPSWQWSPSPITFNSLYGGEDYDARITPEVWRPVVVQQAPRGTLREQRAYPVKVMERFPVSEVVRKEPRLLVVDMGQNLSGFPEITVRGKRGQHIKITPGETLTADRLCNQKQTGRPHYYVYTLGSSATETWHPRFSYYGYRYLQLEGDLDALCDVQSCFVHNAAPRTATFACSNERINKTHQLIDRAIRSNWQAVWTDCPHREKLGWLEQDWLNGEALVYNYDSRSMIEQTMQNIVDAQHPDGSMPETAPEYTVFSGSWAAPFLESPEWGGALIALPFLYRDFYGDDRLLHQYRPQMKRYVDYLATQDSCYILRQGLGDWYDYGPWRAGFARNTPMPLVATAHYYWWNHLMGEARADSIREAFIREFYDPQTHRFATGSQCAQSIALCMDLVPEGDRDAVVSELLADIHRHGDRLTTGDVGNRYLFKALIDSGHRELLYRMLNHDEVPGYGYQIRQGMTTLTEQWDPKQGASMNHFMMAHIENFLIPDLLGIQRRGSSFTVSPHPVGDLTWCKGSIATDTGILKVHWQREGHTFQVDVEVPPGCAVTLRLPGSDTAEPLATGSHQRTIGITN